MSFFRRIGIKSSFDWQMLLNNIYFSRLLRARWFNSLNSLTIRPMDVAVDKNMSIMFPVMLAGGIGVIHRYFSRELDTIFGEFSQPIFGFTGGLSLGIIIGLLLGVNYYEFFNGIFSVLKKVFTWLVGDDIQEDKSDVDGNKKQ